MPTLIILSCPNPNDLFFFLAINPLTFMYFGRGLWLYEFNQVAYWTLGKGIFIGA